MLITGTKDVQIHISPEEKKRIAQEFLREKAGVDEDYFLQDGMLMRHKEEWYGSHSSTKTVTVRAATELDKAYMMVLKDLR